MIEFQCLRISAQRAWKARKAQPSRESLIFMLNLEESLSIMKQQLIDHTYQFGKLKHFWIRDPKLRLISAAPFRDRVLHHALCLVLAPRFETYYIFDSYACRPNKGLHRAIQRAQLFSRRFSYVLKIDIAHFFETANHAQLKQIIQRLIKDQQISKLIEHIIDEGHPRAIHGQGLPIGHLTSQHFANIYLSPFDHWLKQELRIKGYVRYMDDMLIFADDRETLWGYLFEIENYLHTHLHLKLKSQVTALYPTDIGFPFLGFKINPRLIRFDGTRKRRWVKNHLKLFKKYRDGRIQRNDFEKKLTSYQQWLDVCSHPNGLSKATFHLIKGKYDDC